MNNNDIRTRLEEETQNQFGLTFEEYIGFTGVGHIEVIFPVYRHFGGKFQTPTNELNDIFADKDLFDKIQSIFEEEMNK